MDMTVEEMTRTLDGWTADGVVGDAQRAAAMLRDQTAEIDQLRKAKAYWIEKAEEARGQRDDLLLVTGRLRAALERLLNEPGMDASQGAIGEARAALAHTSR